MISWVSDAEVNGRFIDVLQELDPLLSSTVVVEQFPDVSFSDVLTDIHVVLGVRGVARASRCGPGAVAACGIADRHVDRRRR
jgi:hypothetical protein